MKYYANYDVASGKLLTRYVDGIHDNSILTPPPGTANLLISEDDAVMTAKVPGYAVVAGALVAPAAPTQAQLQANADAEAWRAYRAQAKAALDASDVTVLRCVEKAIAVPTEWATYRASLRAIVGATTVGDPTQPLPTKPAYPAGT